MGVYVKGLEMPKVCADCPFWETRYDPGYYNYEHCKALGRIFNECRRDIDPFAERFNDCPLVEIKTPHGKIIEVGKIQSKIENQLKGEEITWYQLREVRRYIHDAPTILEAEEK